MKKFLFFLCVFLIAALAGVMMAKDPGYALFAYQHWTMQMPLWVAGLLIIIGFLLLHNLILLIRGTTSLVKRFGLWKKQHRQTLSHKHTKKGLLELAEGKWASAEEVLVKATEHNSAPLINYLAAARAAQEQSAYDRRDEYLRLAHDSTPGSEMAVGLTQAELQFEHKQFEHSLATLRHLQTLDPKHVYVIKLLAKLYIELKDWQSLAEMLPELKKRKVLKTDNFHLLEMKVYSELLKQASHQTNDTELEKVWLAIPKALKKEKVIVASYVKGLLHLEKNNEAEQVLREALKPGLDNELISLYAATHSDYPEKQLEQAEIWLKHYGNSPSLYLCLGKLCLRNRLWGKARTYLQQCLDLENNAQAYSELAKLLEYLGEKESATKYYRQGLMHMVDKTELLPL